MTGHQLRLWGVAERLPKLSVYGRPLEKLAVTVDCEMFCSVLVTVLGPRDSVKGRNPDFDLVSKFRMLALPGLYGLLLEQAE